VKDIYDTLGLETSVNKTFELAEHKHLTKEQVKRISNCIYKLMALLVSQAKRAGQGE
jgi:hypothetical protein